MSSRLYLQSAILLAFGVLTFTAVGADENTAGFRRFAHTVSPDGAYVFAWGWGEDAEHLDELQEWPPEKDNIEATPRNYLVDAVRGQVLKTIDEELITYAGTPGFSRFSALSAGWSEDGARALAIYEGRWSDDSILWVNPKKGTMVEVLEPMVKAYSRFLKQKLKVEDPGEVSFSQPALLPNGVLVINALARPSVNHPPEYSYQLKLQVKFDGEEPKCTLISAGKAPPVPAEEKLEDELNRVYQQLRAKLKDAGREDLKTKQLQWLKLREALPSELDRRFFTRRRISYLRARAEN